MKGTLYYATKYNATKIVSQWIASELTDANLQVKEIVSGETAEQDSDFYILGSPIYIGKPLGEFTGFLLNNKMHFTNKPIFLFITSWAQTTKYRQACNDFLELSESLLAPGAILMKRSLPGRVLFHQISKKDQKALERLLARLDTMSDEFSASEIVFRDQLDEKECRQFGKDINERVKSGLL